MNSLGELTNSISASAYEYYQITVPCKPKILMDIPSIYQLHEINIGNMPLFFTISEDFSRFFNRYKSCS